MRALLWLGLIGSFIGVMACLGFAIMAEEVQTRFYIFMFAHLPASFLSLMFLGKIWNGTWFPRKKHKPREPGQIH